MSDKISQDSAVTYVAATEPATADYVPIVDASLVGVTDASANKRITLANLKAHMLLDAYAALTTMDSDDTFNIVDTSEVAGAPTTAHKKITYSNLSSIILAKLITTDYLETMRWVVLASGTYSTGASITDSHDGATTFNTVAAWHTPWSPNVGDWCYPAADNGYIYKCITSGAVGGAEPAFGTTVGGDTADNAASWRCAGKHVVTGSASMISNYAGLLGDGIPVRLKIGGAYYYYIIGDYETAGTYRIALFGPPIPGTIQEMAVGRPEMVQFVNLKISGNYGDGAAALLGTDENTIFPWMQRFAYPCAAWLYHKTDDTGANQPTANIYLNGTSYLCADNSDAGWSPSTTGVIIPPGSLGTQTALLQSWRTGRIEVSCTAAGSNGDAADLTAVIALVVI